MQELTDAIHFLTNAKAVGRDEVSVELFKITLNGDPALPRRLLISSSSLYSTATKIGQIAVTTGISHC